MTAARMAIMHWRRSNERTHSNAMLAALRAICESTEALRMLFADVTRLKESQTLNEVASAPLPPFHGTIDHT